MKPALVALAGTVTEAGTVTAALLLDRLTLNPPLGADLLSVTVHASVPAPVIDEFAQEKALKVRWPAFNCRAKDLETPPSAAVRVAV